MYVVTTRTSLRSWAKVGGSVLVILGAIALVSTDLETAVTLMALCVVGYASRVAVASSDSVGSIRQSMGPRATVAVGTLCVVGVIVVAASDVTDALALVVTAVLGYAGYRSGSVVRGAAYGTALGIVGSSVVVCLLVVAVGLGTYWSGGVDALLFTAMFAVLTSVFLLLWVGFVLVVGALWGLVCGSVGGAVARVTHGVE